MSASALRSLLFYIGFALLIAHELDAVAQAEWRLLPLLDQLSDDTAYAAFVILHVPVLAVLMWLTAGPVSSVRWWSRFGIDSFLIVHAALHGLLSEHALYTFDSSLSTSLIFGGGAVGSLHLLLSMRNAN